MDADNCLLATGLVSESYIRQGSQALGTRRHQIRSLLSSRRMPEHGWDEATIEMLVQDAALMDSNNFPGQAGVGEREARIACPLVSRRHFRLAHGIGRSGDIAAQQPKAAGSSLLAKLACCLAGDALRLAGMTGLAPVAVLPVATGMALTLTLLSAKAAAPKGAEYVVWSRIDQKTCLKAIVAANLTPVVVELARKGDELVTDVAAMEAAIVRLGPENVVCVVTTTSCFAPRAPDDAIAVAKLCARTNVAHIINNAYGVQSRTTCAALSAACRRGRVDAIVQSTDKNFMVPVGGAVLAAPADDAWRRDASGAGAGGWLVRAVEKAYPGRAAMSAHLDLLVTLLHWGADGWSDVLAKREALVPVLRRALEGVGAKHGERVLDTPGNPISLALTLDGLMGSGTFSNESAACDGDGGAGCSSSGNEAISSSQQASLRSEANGCAGGKGLSAASSTHSAAAPEPGPEPQQRAATPLPLQPAATAASAAAAAAAAAAQKGTTFFGAMLWTRGVSGTRVVAPGSGKPTSVAGIAFADYGSHCAGGYLHAYLTAAAALGATEQEVELFAARLDKAFGEVAAKARRVGRQREGGGHAAAGTQEGGVEGV